MGMLVAGLPSLLPLEETFFIRSQKMALSSTALPETSGNPSMKKNTRRKSRRSNVTQEDLMAFIMSRKDDEAVPEVPESDGDSSEDDWDRM